MSSTSSIMSDFSQSNAKIMVTALFFEYVVYFVFSLLDAYKKEGPEYVYINEELQEKLKKEQEDKKRDKQAKNAKAKQEKDAKKAEKNKNKNNKKDDGRFGEGRNWCGVVGGCLRFL